MIINPKKIKFETKKDIVDYVTDGLIPSKNNLNSLLSKIKSPTIINDSLPIIGKDIIIMDDLIHYEDRDELIEILQIVYDNRIKNRNTILKIISLLTVGGTILYKIINSKK